MSDFTITYTLSPQQYAQGTAMAALALRADGKSKAVKVGITELVGGVLGMFFVKQNPILLLFVLVSIAMGVYSLCFYPIIFPRSIRKKSQRRFLQSPAANNPITITLGEDRLLSQLAEELTELDYSKLTVITAKEELILTSPSWSAVVPRQSVGEEQFTEFGRVLAAKPLVEKINLA